MAVQPVTIGESTAGISFLAANQEAILVIVGTATAGPTDVPTPCRSDAQPAETFTSGPLVEAASIVIGEGRQPAVLLRVATATPGAYGAVDDGDFTGTADVGVNAATEPNHAWQGHVEFLTGGTVGTAGITYRASLDNGQTQLGVAPLGTGTSILISQGNVEFTLNPNVAALVALVADIRVQVLAHFAEGPTVHNAADVTSGVGIGGVPADLTAAIARINEIRAALLLHAADTPTVHNSADATSFAALPLAATNGPTAVALAIAIKAAYAVHAANIVVHDAADATNIITAADATQGTVNAGDIIRVPTTAPMWNSAGLTTALATLPGYGGHPFGGLLILGAIPDLGSYTAIVNALDALEEQQRPCSAIIEERLPNDGETEAQYRTALETIWSNRSDNRLSLCSGDGSLDPVTVRQARWFVRRMHTAPFAARCVALRYEQNPALVDPIARAPGPTPSTFGGPLRGYRIYDDAGAAIGHDERNDPGLSDLRFVTTTSYPQEGTSVYIHKAYTLRQDNDTVYLLPIRRMANVWKRIVYKRLTEKVGTYQLRIPGQTTIAPAAANDLSKFIYGHLRTEFTGRASGVSFEVDLTTDVTVPDPRILWGGTLVTGYYIDGFDGVVAINQDT